MQQNTHDIKAEGEKDLMNNGDREDQEQRYALKCHNKIPQEAFRYELC